jgi:phosphoethanolamine N-methyltransferase
VSEIDIVNFQDVYVDDYVELIEFAYGDGYLSAGGPEFTREMFEGVDLHKKKILSIGCGLGGVELDLASQVECEVVGIDVAPYVIEVAEDNKAKYEDLLGDVQFYLGDLDSLEYRLESASFDVIYSKEVFLHIEDKVTLFNKVFNLLKPGGKLLVVDWMLPPNGYTKRLEDYLEFDNITAFLITTDAYGKALTREGFDGISSENITTKIVAHTDGIIDVLNQDEAVGDKYGDDYIPSWQMMRDVMAEGNLEVALIKAAKA